MNIVITGSTKGIGFAMANEFLKRGDNVCISSRSQDHVDNALADLQTKYSDQSRVIIGTICDVTNKEDLTQLGQFALEEFGKIDIWINNAGTKGNQAGNLSEIQEKGVRLPIETNLIGTLLGTQAALEIMLKQKDLKHENTTQKGFGKIFNMEGLGSNGRASPENIAYGASKAALPQVLKTLKKELEGTGILINNISPGMVLTDLLLENNQDRSQKKLWKIVNILAEKPETVAEFLVPRMKKVKKSGKRIQFLTNFKAAIRFMTWWRYKNRWFDEEGKRKF